MERMGESMGVSKDEFSNLYDPKTKLVGSGSPEELEENYRYYTTWWNYPAAWESDISWTQ